MRVHVNKITVRFICPVCEETSTSTIADIVEVGLPVCIDDNEEMELLDYCEVSD